MVINSPSAFEAFKGSEEKNLSFDPLSFLSKLEHCSCYREFTFNPVSPDEIWHPNLLFSYFLVFTANPGIWNIIPGKQVVFVEKDPWRRYAMPAWLQSFDIHSSSLDSENFCSSVLRSRDLIAVEPEYFYFEAYNPQLVARQFGLIHMLVMPYFLTHNDP